MIHSTNAYNANPVDGIILQGRSLVFRQSVPRASVNYQGYSYHYEFLIHGGDLYACIHCAHHNPSVNLKGFFDSFFSTVIQPRLIKAGFPTVHTVPIPGLPPNSHVINIPCLKYGEEYGESNGNLMRQLITAIIRINP